jgi:hypothetical protein
MTQFDEKDLFEISNYYTIEKEVELKEEIKRKIVTYFYRGLAKNELCKYSNYILSLNQQKINELFDRLNTYPREIIIQLFILKHMNKYSSDRCFFTSLKDEGIIDNYLKYLFNLIDKSDKEQRVVIKKQEVEIKNQQLELNKLTERLISLEQKQEVEIKNQQLELNKLTERLISLEQKQKDTDDWIEDIEDELDDNKTDVKITDLLDL